MDAGAVQVLSDRAEIHDLLMRYARVVDRREADKMSAVFARDGELIGADGRRSRGIDEIVRSIARVDRYHTTFHLVGNVHIETQGDTATAEVYATAYHFYNVDGDEREHVTGIRYVDGVVRTDAGWRIKRRRLVQDWERGVGLPANGGDEGNRTPE